MSASKKLKSTSKSPAPATKTVSSAKPAVKKTPARAETVRSETLTPVAMLAPAAPASPAVTIKAVESKPIVTTVTARIDVGFGNALFLRGEGPGLSWDTGLAMECAGSDVWSITLVESARAYTFKFLLNDTTWSKGPDFTVACGTSITLTPEF